MKARFLKIRNLYASTAEKTILHGVNLDVAQNVVTVLMGPNGSGKSTLAHVLMGAPDYIVDQGSITFQGKNILPLSTDVRAKMGLFLGFQHPSEVAGVHLYDLLLTATQKQVSKSSKLRVPFERDDFDQRLEQARSALHLSEDFIDRALNVGMSGGEKKKSEMLQLSMLQPKLVILDEIDSGLDIDSIKIIAKRIKALWKRGMTFLIITHYHRILEYLPVHAVSIMQDGKIIQNGDRRLIRSIEKTGYEQAML